ncbi:MAG: hypothetical protein LKF48_08900 [Prevotella sp.]|nr:hypothetical protein [Prevotella sp.]MCH4183257.1 hypothetical protein [Prevotella sp.]MCH4213025.1 hypothetical protein [Prevotella sp.]MCH4242117.1 hypothetical protein [Prevotella sp.]
MICKNRVLLLAFCMVMTEPGRAQTELTQITSASDSTELVDGGLYLFSSDVVIEKKRYGYAGCHISKSSYRPADHIIYYMGGPPYFSQVSAAVPGSDLVRLYKSGTDDHGNCRYLMYDVTNGFYIFQDTTYPVIYRHRSDKGETTSRHLCLMGSGRKFRMLMGNRTLRYQKNMCYYSAPTDAYYKRDPDRYSAVLLYRIDRLDGFRNLMASGSDLTAVKGDTMITVDRKFKDNRFNTLMLPCAVRNYKEVFGLHVQAYELDKKEMGGIVFRKVEGDDLQANVPYLISGRFAQAPYIIAPTSVDLPADYRDDQVDVNLNGNHFVGIYRDKQLQGLRAYMLSDNKLFYCKNADCRLKAFCWYMTVEDAEKCKLCIVDGKGMLDVISKGGTSGTGSSRYRLRGSRIPRGELNSRPHGFCLDTK